ncbi:MAG: hypothetical protein ACO1Q7_06145 [Gemmatimonas sp.]
MKPSKRYSKKNTPKMLDHHEARSTRADAEQNRDQRKVLTLRPMIDREVPVRTAAAESIGDMPVVVQQWLDGDVAERTARRTDDSSVDIWNKISVETARRRRMETPALMSERVMAVLPKKKAAPTDLLFQRFKITPAVAIIAAMSMVAAGVLVGEYLLH